MHESSLALNTSSIFNMNEGIWQIQSTSGSSNLYAICENNTSCECQLYCSHCKAYIHKYSCDCIDCAIRWNMQSTYICYVDTFKNRKIHEKRLVLHFMLKMQIFFLLYKFYKQNKSYSFFTRYFFI